MQQLPCLVVVKEGAGDIKILDLGGVEGGSWRNLHVGVRVGDGGWDSIMVALPPLSTMCINKNKNIYFIPSHLITSDKKGKGSMQEPKLISCRGHPFLLLLKKNITVSYKIFIKLQ